MPVTFQGTTATLAGECTVEEAAPLCEWLLAHPKARVQLAGCTGLHTALLQTLMALRPALAALPDDAALARAIAAVLPDPAPARPRTRTRKRPAAREMAA